MQRRSSFHPVSSLLRLLLVTAAGGLLLPLCLSEESETLITFPADSGIVDVTTFGAVPDDAEDDTVAIQTAINQFPGGNRIVYLPPGQYLLSDTLRWPDSELPGQTQKRVILQGASESSTILKLQDKTPAFATGPTKPVIWTGEKPAQRFRNAIRDLTIDVGSGNRNASGIQFNASRQGGIRNVTIRAASDSGRVGLDLGHTDEIGPLLVRNLTVDGFDVGITTKWPVNSNTFEQINLTNQRRYGWWNYHQMIFVRGLTSYNYCTALYNERNSWGAVTLLDAHIHGKGNPKTPGILNQRHLFLKEVEIQEYRRSIENDDRGRDRGDLDGAQTIQLGTSHHNVSSLFRKVEDSTFATAGEVKLLPVKETPKVPWGNPDSDWVNILSFGADPQGESDSSPALQQAIDAGKKTVYLPASAEFRFEGQVFIRGPVERLIGLEGRLSAQENSVWKLVDGQHPTGLPDAPTVIIERLFNRNGGNELKIRQESKRTLVVSSSMGFSVEGHGTGDLFLDDVSGHLDRVAPGQNVWCRQLNSERKGGTKCRNMGGNLWILGMKAQELGTVMELTGGGHTEVNGLFLYSNAGWKEEEPAIMIQDSSATFFGINERNFNRSPVSFWISETQEGETREMKDRPWIFLSR